MREGLKNPLRWCCFLTVLFAVCAAPGWAQTPHGTSAPGRWQPPPPPKSWKAPEVKGYTDGVKAAWVDLAAGAKPHPERQVLYLKPPASITLGQRFFYREGFRKGYDVVYAHQRATHPQQASEQE